MSIERIKDDLEDLLDKIECTCNELNIKHYTDKDKKPVQIRIERNNQASVLRLYNKKDGFKLDTTVGKDKTLNSEVENMLKDRLEYTDYKNYTYRNIEDEDFKKTLDLIDLYIGREIIKKDRKINDPNKTHFFEIKNTISNETVRISRFRNQSVYIEGVVWFLWEDACQIIEVCINADKYKILHRLLINSEDKKDVCDKEEEFTKEENHVRKILGDEVFEYLDAHYQDYLISAACIMINDVKMKEYSTVLCPIAKVLEGYLKKLLIDLKLEKVINMKKAWRFGDVITQRGLNIDKKNIITDKQEQELVKLYKLVSDFRNDVNHGSPKPRLIVRDKTICLAKYKEVLKVVKESYYRIYS